jgi:nitrogenase iron protein NifH
MAKTANKIVIYGKGGIGKSTIASNLSMVYAKRGQKVLQVGCDPKHDSTIWLLKDKNKITTVMDAATQKSRMSITRDDIIMKGKNNIDCIECGGPKAGVGCAGRGISLMFEILNDLDIINRYDTVIFDVLGDVVCGGFAAPLKLNFAEKVFIVISEEFASLYAANNISQAVTYYGYNGIYLGGLILNLRDNQADIKRVQDFARRLNSTILAKIPRSREIAAADIKSKTVVEAYSGSAVSGEFSSLADKIRLCRKSSSKKVKPIEEGALYKIFSR